VTLIIDFQTVMYDFVINHGLFLNHGQFPTCMTATLILTYIITHMIHVQCTDGRGIVREEEKDGRGVVEGVKFGEKDGRGIVQGGKKTGGELSRMGKKWEGSIWDGKKRRGNVQDS